jgi:hypothetical protein
MRHINFERPIADRIMNWGWGYQQWDNKSPAHNFWKRQVKKKKRSIGWWNKNWRRIYEAHS